MKKENFVETNEQSRGTLEALIRAHNANNDAHGALRSVIDLGLLAHKGDFDLHVSETEREAWNNAAGAAEKIGEVEHYVERAEAARGGAESARDDAEAAYRSAIEEKKAAATSAVDAKAAKDTVESYINDAKGAKDAAYGAANTAAREADNATSESKRALSSANRASEAAGNAARHANRAEDAAKKAEALTEKVRNKADAGVTIESMDALPENAMVGVLYTVKYRVATNGYKVTGKVSDLFLTGDTKEDDLTDDEPGRMYLYAPQFLVPDAYVSSTDCIWVYDCSGRKISQMSYPYSGGYPDWEYLSTFGADSVDDEITLYVAELSQPMELEPDEIIFEDVERALYHNGESWVEIVTAKRLGDIDKALDAILALDEKLLGGDS